MDGLCHFSLADAVVCGAFANLEGDTGIEARVAVAKRNAHVDHGIGIRLVEGADSRCIGVTVMTITDSEACFISRVEIKRMERCQSIAAGCRSVDIRIQTAVRVVHVAVNLLRVGGSQTVDVADVSRTVRIVSIADNTRDYAARLVALCVLAADIDLRGLAVRTNLDGVTLVIRVNQVTCRLESRIQSRQVLTDRIVTLDIGTIAIDMDFLIELLAIDGIRTAIAQSTILDVGDGRTTFTCQRDCCLIGIFVILNCIVTEVLRKRIINRCIEKTMDL